MILLPTYLTYLTYYNPALLLESSASSSSAAASAHMPEEGREKVSMWTRMGTVKFGRSTVS